MQNSPDNSIEPIPEQLIAIYNPIDAALFKASQALGFYSHLGVPSGKEYEDQREDFFAGRIKEPTLKFITDPPNLDLIVKEIEGLSIPSDNAILKEILTRQRQRVLSEIDAVIHRDDKERVKAIGIELFGAPSPSLVAEAESILRSTPEKKIYVPAESLGRKFSEKEPEYLNSHEVGVHVFCSANGYAQPLLPYSFGLGLPGYLMTQEGLGVYAGERSRTANPNVLRRIATRVVTTDSLVTGDSFKEAYERLKEFYPSDPNSHRSVYDAIVRAYHPGLPIDHVYLEGLMRVRDFVKDGGDLRDLYVGKVGIDDLKFLVDLKKQGLIRGARHFPSFFERR